MNDQRYIRNIFCAGEQQITPHLGYTDGNGEYVFVCQQQIDTKIVKNEAGEEIKQPVFCGRFLKLPADIEPDPAVLDKFLAAHQQANEGQISIEKQNENLRKLLGITDDNGEEQQTTT